MTKTPVSGLGVDATGGPVIDPTANVIALNEASHKRQDDLRVETGRRVDAELAHLKELIEIQAAHSKEMGEVRAAFEKELREAESARVNAIRQVDVSAVSTAADRTLAAVQTLAATAKNDAENLRSTLTNTAATIATQTTNTVATINERIANLEKSSYEGKGKQLVADPQMERLAQLVERLAAAQSVGTGKVAGVGLVWAALLGSVGLVGGLLGIAGILYGALKP